MAINTQTTQEVFNHAFKYARDTAGAKHDIAVDYANYYCKLTEEEMDTQYWPSHRNLFWEWSSKLKDWRE